MAKKATAKKTAGRKKAAKRELIDTGTDKRFVRRGAAGKFKESDDVGKSLVGRPSQKGQDEGQEWPRRQRRPVARTRRTPVRRGSATSRKVTPTTDWRSGSVDRGRRPHLTPGSTDLSRPGHLQDSARALLRRHRRLDRASRGRPAADARSLPGGTGRTLHLSETREGVGAERASASEDPGEDEDRRIPRRRFNRGRRLARADGHRRNPHVEFNDGRHRASESHRLGSRSGACRSRGNRSSKRPVSCATC